MTTETLYIHIYIYNTQIDIRVKLSELCRHYLKMLESTAGACREALNKVGSCGLQGSAGAFIIRIVLLGLILVNTYIYPYKHLDIHTFIVSLRIGSTASIRILLNYCVKSTILIIVFECILTLFF